MSALELYAPMTEFPNFTAIISLIVLICAMLFIQVNIHLMYTDEVDRLKTSIDKRITALHEDVDKTIQRLSPLEEVTKTLLDAQEEIDADLDNHDELLEEHGEDISLAAAAAYASAPKTNSQSLQITMGLPQAFNHSVQYILDDHIKNYLNKTELATAREIFKHLQEDKATQAEWVKMYSTGQKITRHDVNSRLYSLLAHGELKKDDSARPVWSMKI
jgi:hypothetical protein